MAKSFLYRLVDFEMEDATQDAPLAPL